MLLVSSAAAEEGPAPASANADTGRIESIILSASIMLRMRFFMISSPLSVDLSGYTPKRNSRNGQKRQVEYSTKLQGNKAFLRTIPAKKWCKIMGKITIRGGGMLFSHKKAVPKRPQAFRNCSKNMFSAIYARSNAERIQNRFTFPPTAPPARLSGRADGSLPRQRSRPRAARTERWRSPRPGGRADSAAPARPAWHFPADGR